MFYSLIDSCGYPGVIELNKWYSDEGTSHSETLLHCQDWLSGHEGGIFSNQWPFKYLGYQSGFSLEKKQKKKKKGFLLFFFNNWIQ